MLGIQNADGTFAWLLFEPEERRARATLSPVRMGQNKFRVRVWQQNEQGSLKLLGECRFKAQTGPFLDRPEFPTFLELDGQGRLSLRIDLGEKLIMRSYTLPRPTGTHRKPRYRGPRPGQVSSPALATYLLGFLGLGAWITAVIMALQRGLFT